MRCLQQCQDAHAELRILRLQSSNQIGEKAHGIVVLRLQGEPGNGNAACLDPLGQERGFAKPGGSRDERQGALHPLLQAQGEVGT